MPKQGDTTPQHEIPFSGASPERLRMQLTGPRGAAEPWICKGTAVISRTVFEVHQMTASQLVWGNFL